MTIIIYIIMINEINVNFFDFLILVINIEKIEIN